MALRVNNMTFDCGDARKLAQGNEFWIERGPSERGEAAGVRSYRIGS